MGYNADGSYSAVGGGHPRGGRRRYYYSDPFSYGSDLLRDVSSYISDFEHYPYDSSLVLSPASRSIQNTSLRDEVSVLFSVRHIEEYNTLCNKVEKRWENSDLKRNRDISDVATVTLAIQMIRRGLAKYLDHLETGLSVPLSTALQRVCCPDRSSERDLASIFYKEAAHLYPFSKDADPSNPCSPKIIPHILESLPNLTEDDIARTKEYTMSLGADSLEELRSIGHELNSEIQSRHALKTAQRFFIKKGVTEDTIHEAFWGLPNDPTIQRYGRYITHLLANSLSDLKDIGRLSGYFGYEPSNKLLSDKLVAQISGEETWDRGVRCLERTLEDFRSINRLSHLMAEEFLSAAGARALHSRADSMDQSDTLRRKFGYCASVQEIIALAGRSAGRTAKQRVPKIYIADTGRAFTQF